MQMQGRLVLLAVAISIAGLAVYRISGRSAKTEPTTIAQGTAAIPVPQGWESHSDPVGLSVQTPVGWTMNTDRHMGRVDLHGAASEQIIIWPIFVPGLLDASSAVVVLRRLASQVLPDVAWNVIPTTSSNTVRMSGRSSGRSTLALLTWTAGPKGSAAYLYLISAPEQQFRQGQGDFARILQSLNIAGPQAGETSSAPQVNYVAWQDPRERAFTVEVPNQWKVTGGLFRFASVDTRPVVDMTSPDGQIHVTGGDAEIPPFTIPNQTLKMSGFSEGSWYSPGYGVNMMVRNYHSGVEFAKEYVSTKVARNCENLDFVQERDRPDVAKAINSIYSQFGAGVASMQLSTGEVAFTCTSGGRPMAGYYFAGTLLTQVAGMPGGLWSVQMLYGFLATPDQATTAQGVLDHGLQTFQYNPAWWKMQQNLAGLTSQIVTKTNNEISNIINDNYWSKQTSDDELSRRRSNATLGLVDVIDEATGREIKVESGSNYYWIDPRGAIVGTDTYTKPSIDFRELLQLP